MRSIDSILTRALATRDAQASVSGAWVWSQKTVLQWTNDITLLDQLRMAEIDARTWLRSASHAWQADLDLIQQNTRDVARVGKVQFRNDAIKLALFEALRTDARTRTDVQIQGEAAKCAWNSSDPAWVVIPGLDMGVFGSLLSSALARREAHHDKRNGWRKAAAALRVKASALDADSVAWYAEATTRFRAGTTEGDMIRSSVPTQTSTAQRPDQAVIRNVMVSGNEIHFDVAAPHATRFTYLHKPPGALGFSAIVSESEEESLTLHGQPVGEHSFKAVGVNSRGSGPESAVTTVAVAQQQAG